MLSANRKWQFSGKSRGETLEGYVIGDLKEIFILHLLLQHLYNTAESQQLEVIRYDVASNY